VLIGNIAAQGIQEATAKNEKEKVMATVTVTFEDVDNGVSVKVISDPPFPGPHATAEEHEALTDAQHMGLRMTELLTERLAEEEGHCHDEHCTHHHHDHES